MTAKSLLPLLLVALVGCRGDGWPGALGGKLHEIVEPSPRARYVGTLTDSSRTTWNNSAVAALSEPLPTALPFREALAIGDDLPAVAYTFGLIQGERLRLTVESAAPLFVDAFGPAAVDSLAAVEPLTEVQLATTETERDERLGRDLDLAVKRSGDSLVVQFDAHRTGRYAVRLQPASGHSERVVVAAERGPSLGFPVAGKTYRAIGSFWGVDRDGGRRRHEGNDLFAPKRTPVVAASDGFVSWVGLSTLGGKVVWLWAPDKGHTQYYAHLDSQLVAAGRSVRRGDTLGLVGNTGNARTTPSHLHFGIYLRGHGAVDPYPFLADPPTPDRPITAPLAPLGRSVQVTIKKAEVKAVRPVEVAVPARTVQRRGRRVTIPASTRTETPVLATLTRGDSVRVIGATGDRYRIRLPDGQLGFLPAAALAPAALTRR